MKNWKESNHHSYHQMISFDRKSQTQTPQKQKPVRLQMVFFSQHEIGSHVDLFSVLALTLGEKQRFALWSCHF